MKILAQTLISQMYEWFVTLGRPYLRASATAAHSSKARSMADWRPSPSKAIALCSLMPRCGDAETSKKTPKNKGLVTLWAQHGNIAKQRRFLSISELFLASANHSCHIVHRLLPAYQSNVWDSVGQESLVAWVWEPRNLQNPDVNGQISSMAGIQPVLNWSTSQSLGLTKGFEQLPSGSSTSFNSKSVQG